MIQFFIENQEVVLPDDFSFTQVDENSLITNKGEFSLDITYSLVHPKNAKAFKYINRINNIVVGVKYNAKMLDFWSTKFGSVVVTRYSRTEVVVQFLVGYSELNYNSTEDGRKIWELSWDTEDTLDYARALESIQNPGYSENKNFVCAPVQIGSDIANEFLLSNAKIDNTVSPVKLTTPVITGVNNIVMQPYLMYYIVNLPSLLGFSIGTNCLENDVRANNLYLINSVRSLNYADALPDMTISKFIDEIEFFFNVIFDVDKASKKINIISLNNFAKDLPLKKLKNVFDEYEVEPSEEEDGNRLGWTKLAYNLSNTGFFKYQHLTDDIIQKLQVVTFASETDLISYNFHSTDLNKFKVYRDNQTSRDYIYCRDPDEMIFNILTTTAGVTLYYINKFSAYGTGSNKLSLQLTPAEMIKGEVPYKVINIGTGGGTITDMNYECQRPKSTFSNIVDVETQNVIDAIENDIYSIERSDKISVALAMKPINLLSIDSDWELFTSVKYPFSYVDFVPEYGYEKKLPYNSGENLLRFSRWLTWVSNQFNPNAKTTLRLNGNNGVVKDYRTESKLDLSKLYYFIFPDTVDIITKNRFEYQNQIYLPIRFEREKSKTIGLVKGTFYRML